jgi:hypothetical protein
MKEESKIYHRIIFDLKKESDENEMNFDEVIIKFYFNLVLSNKK